MSVQLFDFDGLENDTDLKTKIETFQKSIDSIEETMKTIMKPKIYENLSTKQKVNHDLFFAYSLCTLMWMYLRTSGTDPNQTAVKNELVKIKEHMNRLKSVDDRVLRPQINKEASKRFVKNALWKSNEPPKKKTKLNV